MAGPLDTEPGKTGEEEFVRFPTKCMLLMKNHSRKQKISCFIGKSMPQIDNSSDLSALYV